jgi:hypothetical protein
MREGPSPRSIQNSKFEDSRVKNMAKKYGTDGRKYFHLCSTDEQG